MVCLFSRMITFHPICFHKPCLRLEFHCQTCEHCQQSSTSSCYRVLSVRTRCTLPTLHADNLWHTFELFPENASTGFSLWREHSLQLWLDFRHESWIYQMKPGNLLLAKYLPLSCWFLKAKVSFSLGIGMICKRREAEWLYSWKCLFWIFFKCYLYIVA